MRFIPTSVHGMLDYLFGILLILAPWLFDFADGTAAQWTAIIVGAAILTYSVFTRYELGLIPLIDMRTHLVLGAVAGIFLAISPWLFMFAHRVWVPHVVIGLLEVASVLLTETHPRSLMAPVGRSERTSVGA